MRTGIERSPRVVTMLTSATARVAVLLIGGALVMTACGTSGGTAESSSAAASPTGAGASPSETNPYGSAPAVDPPGPNDPVLTIQGADGQQIQLTATQLQSLDKQSITIDEPFVKKQEQFTGVPMSALLALASIPGSATIDTVALNDYTYSAPASQFTDSQALVAYQVDGKDIPLAEGGPVRIVFPTGSAQFSNLDAWNWSLEAIQQK